jgi:hypothetical protein
MLVLMHVEQSFCWVLIMGSLWETLSFSIRSVATHNQQSVGLEPISSLFVLIAPLWVNTIAYTVLGRIIYFFLLSRSLFTIPASTLALLFASLLVCHPDCQRLVCRPVCSGGSANERRVYLYGRYWIATILHLCFSRIGGEVSSHYESPFAKPGWKRPSITLYVSLICISTRIFFWLVESSAGKTAPNPLPFHESYFYVLEGFSMGVAIGGVESCAS